MYDYEDYKFVPRVQIDDHIVCPALPYDDYQTAYDALQGIVDAEAHTGCSIRAYICLAGIYYKGDGNIASMTNIITVYEKYIAKFE